MQHTDKIREEFEEWFWKNCAVAGLAAKLSAWQAWQASRAALVIELPQEYALPPVMDHETLVNACREQDRAAIKAAGVTVRG